MKSKLLFAVVSITLSLMPKPNFGQAPQLHSDSSYAVLTATGPISNAGPTLIVGNLGTTNVGGITGFPPGTVIGGTNSGDDSARQAALDVVTTYNYLLSMTCDTVLSDPNLGSGQTLTARVYCIGEAATLSGNIILDGKNNPNALFIFKMDGAFSTEEASQVTLINQASANNVYWQVNGEMDYGSASVFKGTTVAKGAINALDGASIVGRALSTVGAIQMTNNTIMLPTSTFILPVTLLGFTATKQGSGAIIKWSTGTEENSKNFIVEHSISPTTAIWKTIGTIAAAGNSTITKQYSLMDENVNVGNNYYRLRSTNIDGTSTISSMAVLYFSALPNVLATAYPNPIINNITITGAIKFSTINLMDAAGKIIMTQQANGGSDQMVTTRLLPGTYLLKIVSPTGNATTIKLSKF